jgi:hypothetical protein
MNKSNLLKQANELVKGKWPNLKFKSIVDATEEDLTPYEGLWTMAENDTIEIVHSMAVFPTHFIFASNRIYLIF